MVKEKELTLDEFLEALQDAINDEAQLIPKPRGGYKNLYYPTPKGINHALNAVKEFIENTQK